MYFYIELLLQDKLLKGYYRLGIAKNVAFLSFVFRISIYRTAKIAN